MGVRESGIVLYQRWHCVLTPERMMRSSGVRLAYRLPDASRYAIGGRGVGDGEECGGDGGRRSLGR
jgi:hypothetical protein